jgi:hypothetical protein
VTVGARGVHVYATVHDVSELESLPGIQEHMYGVGC